MLDSLLKRAGGRGNVNPMQIAHNTLLTHREKIDLLTQLKTEMAKQEESAEFSAEELDIAIQEVRIASQNNDGSHTILG